MHPLAVAETTDTSKASGGSRDHGGLLRKPDPKKKNELFFILDIRARAILQLSSELQVAVQHPAFGS